MVTITVKKRKTLGLKKAPPAVEMPTTKPKLIPRNVGEMPEFAKPKEAWAWLKDNYPVFKKWKPLAIGVNEEIVALAPPGSVNQHLLAMALGLHVKMVPYHLSLAESKSMQRYHLDGSPAGPLLERHQERAKQEHDILTDPKKMEIRAANKAASAAKRAAKREAKAGGELRHQIHIAEDGAYKEQRKLDRAAAHLVFVAKQAVINAKKKANKLAAGTDTDHNM